MEIIKGKFSLKQIFKDHWHSFLKKHPSFVTWYIALNVWKMMNCREPDGLGFMTFACPAHPEQHCRVPRSCKSRFCPVCAKVQIDKWVSDMTAKFPNCPYFHITFTVPSQLRILLFEKRFLLDAVFHAAAETLLSFCKEQGFLPAITMVIHTFGGDLKWHIHIHCVVSAGGLKLSGKQPRYTRKKIKRRKRNGRVKINTIRVLINKPEWIHAYFPYKMLHKRYQALLIEYLKKHIKKNLNSNNTDNDLQVFSDPDVMKSFFDDLKEEYKKGFYVTCSKERIDLKPTMGYICRYARRPPISEVRIKDYTGDYVTFEYKDYYADGLKTKLTIRTTEFIKRIIRHIPPHYFNAIRHYGLIASRVKTWYNKTVNKLLGVVKGVKKAKTWQKRQSDYHGKDPLICKICGRIMRFVSASMTTPISRIKKHFQAIFA